jgi:hypothetical protein
MTPTRRCTWQDPPDRRCPNEATKPQVGTTGEQWADLCEHHAVELDASIACVNAQDYKPVRDIRNMMRCWVSAGGGAKKMAKRMSE